MHSNDMAETVGKPFYNQVQQKQMYFYPGILKDKTMHDKFMYIHNVDKQIS